MSSLNSFGLLCLSIILLSRVVVSFDYGAALTKSLLYYEAQRSGKLPPSQRVTWRGDSALHDGKDAGVNLLGGYYDAGDNVKFGFPMAFTITMLSWSTFDFYKELTVKKELNHAMEAIKWGTDYLIKAHPKPNVLYGQVGEGDADHACWQRPEDMTTPRTTYKIDEQHPGADLAGETAAALAAASIVFRIRQPQYANLLITHAKQLFDFASKHPGLYQNSIPAEKFYKSSGYDDELLWAAAWLYTATKDKTYLHYLGSTQNTGGIRSELSWNDKFVGAQALVAQLVLGRKIPASGIWTQYKSQAEGFICNLIQKGNNNMKMTPGGLLWVQPFNNLQYTATASLLVTSYAKSLSAVKASLSCPHGTVRPSDLTAFAKSQVDYILGKNPQKTSYMVGFGPKYPTRVHHRGASIISIKKDPKLVTCGGGFAIWFNRNLPNPNVLQGAIIGGPDQSDGYTDIRSNFQSNEPSTINVAPLVGVLASLA